MVGPEPANGSTISKPRRVTTGIVVGDPLDQLACAAEQAAAKATTVAAFTRLRPSRQPFPARLPRERVVIPADIESSARRKAEGKAPAPISPLVLEIVQRIDALFEIERGITGKLTSAAPSARS